MLEESTAKSGTVMDRLKAIEVFVAVAQAGGFAPAAAKLGLSTSSVSRHVSNLEDSLGVQLLHRSTRNLRLTPEGEDVLEHGQKIVAHVDRMMEEQQNGRASPQGKLRITIARFLSNILMRNTIAEFSRTHPEVDMEIVLLDRVVNLIEEGFDLAIRVGHMPDSSLKTRKLLDLHLGVVGSPDYFARRGVPQTPACLDAHDCVIDTAAPYANRWPMLSRDGRRVLQVVHGNVSVNSGRAARDLAIGGAGLTYLPEYVFFDHVEKGRLVTVLDTFAIDYGGIFLVYPPSRHQGAAIRRFVDLLVEHAKPVQRYRDARRLAQQAGAADGAALCEAEVTSQS